MPKGKLSDAPTSMSGGFATSLANPRRPWAGGNSPSRSPRVLSGRQRCRASSWYWSPPTRMSTAPTSRTFRGLQMVLPARGSKRERPSWPRLLEFLRTGGWCCSTQSPISARKVARANGRGGATRYSSTPGTVGAGNSCRRGACGLWWHNSSLSGSDAPSVSLDESPPRKPLPRGLGPEDHGLPAFADRHKARASSCCSLCSLAPACAACAEPLNRGMRRLML